MAYLLDANVLIALVVREHEHHERASRWILQGDRIALCSVVEGAMIRALLRLGESHATAVAILTRLYGEAVEFWSDELSYVDVPMKHVTGHRQVTDAYLAELAHRAGAKLATFDRGLAAALPDRVELIP